MIAQRGENILWHKHWLGIFLSRLFESANAGLELPTAKQNPVVLFPVKTIFTKKNHNSKPANSRKCQEGKTSKQY